MTAEEQVFFEIHADNPREGPGSLESARKAFELIPALGHKPVILDAGCGPGAQTLHLSELSSGDIYAIDLHGPFVDRLRSKVAERLLEGRVFVKQGDMADPGFPDGFFDLIWAEGSIYQIGFGNGLDRWRRLLKPGGCVAATEITWLKDNPPSELFNFWNSQYPAMQSLSGNLRTIAENGYRLIGHFTLPESDWWNEYYHAISMKLDSISRKHAGQPEALKAVQAEKTEMALFRKYSDYYGYVFYIIRKS